MAEIIRRQELDVRGVEAALVVGPVEDHSRDGRIDDRAEPRDRPPGALVVVGAALVGRGVDRDLDRPLGRIETLQTVPDRKVGGARREAGQDRHQRDRGRDRRADRQPLARPSPQTIGRQTANPVGEHRRMITYVAS